MSPFHKDGSRVLPHPQDEGWQSTKTHATASTTVTLLSNIVNPQCSFA